MKPRSVVITGYGFVTPFGDDPDALWRRVCDRGNSPLATGAEDDDQRVPDELLKQHLKGRNLRPLDRTSRLLASAAKLALTSSGLADSDRDVQEIGIISGTMFSSAHTISEFDCRAVSEGPAYASPLDFANTVLNSNVGQTSIVHTLRDENTTIATGLTSGLRAIAHGFETIRAGRANVLLAGGVEELSDELQCAFSDSDLLADGSAGSSTPWDRRRNGFVINEAAALVVLEDRGTATRRGAEILAEIRGSGSAFDCLSRADAGVSIESMTRAMKLAMRDASTEPAAVDCVVASANGSPREDRHESAAVTNVFGRRLDRVNVLVPKAALGESIGAGGPLQVIALLQSMRHGRLHGVDSLEPAEDCSLAHRVTSETSQNTIRNALVSSVCFDGHSCSVIVSRHDRWSPSSN